MEEIDWGKGNVFDLEDSVKRKIHYHLDRAWRPNSNNDLHAIAIHVLCGIMRSAGYNVDDIYMLWYSKYNAYKAEGGRAKYRQLGG